MVAEVSKEPVELVMGGDISHSYIKDVIETALKNKSDIALSMKIKSDDSEEPSSQIIPFEALERTTESGSEIKTEELVDNLYRANLLIQLNLNFKGHDGGDFKLSPLDLKLVVDGYIDEIQEEYDGGDLSFRSVKGISDSLYYKGLALVEAGSFDSNREAVRHLLLDLDMPGELGDKVMKQVFGRIGQEEEDDQLEFEQSPSDAPASNEVSSSDDLDNTQAMNGDAGSKNYVEGINGGAVTYALVDKPADYIIQGSQDIAYESNVIASSFNNNVQADSVLIDAKVERDTPLNLGSIDNQNNATFSSIGLQG